MKTIPPGTICEMVNYTGRAERYNGKEVTVVGPHSVYRNVHTGENDEGYPLDFAEGGVKIYAERKNLKVKKFPPDSMFDSFLNKLVQPLGHEEMKSLKEEDKLVEKA